MRVSTNPLVDRIGGVFFRRPIRFTAALAATCLMPLGAIDAQAVTGPVAIELAPSQPALNAQADSLAPVAQQRRDDRRGGDRNGNRGDNRRDNRGDNRGDRNGGGMNTRFQGDRGQERGDANRTRGMTTAIQPAQRTQQIQRDYRQGNRAGTSQAQPFRQDNRDYTRDAQRNNRQDNRVDRRDYRQDNRADRRDYRQDNRADRRDYRQDNRSDRRDYRQDNRSDRRDYRGDARRDYRDWNRNWRQDRRYNWNSYRSANRNIYRSGRYYAPYRGYSYRRFGIGIAIGSPFYSSNYWINDPYYYRLPPAYGPYRWVRYYDDVMLVNIYTGYVADVIYDFFY